MCVMYVTCLDTGILTVCGSESWASATENISSSCHRLSQPSRTARTSNRCGSHWHYLPRHVVLLDSSGKWFMVERAARRSGCSSVMWWARVTSCGCSLIESLHLLANYCQSIGFFWACTELGPLPNFRSLWAWSVVELSLYSRTVVASSLALKGTTPPQSCKRLGTPLLCVVCPVCVLFRSATGSFLLPLHCGERYLLP